MSDPIDDAIRKAEGKPLRGLSLRAGIEAAHFHDERRVRLERVSKVDRLPLKVSGMTSYQAVQFFCPECLDRVEFALDIELIPDH